MSNRLQFISKVLYRLKRRYGEPLRIIWRESSTVNRETGEKTVTHDAFTVNRAIPLPSVIQREFSYDLAYIAAGKNFTYGGFFDTSVRRFIIDTKDLPVDFEISVGQYFVFDGQRYDVKQVERFEDARAFFVTGKQSLAVETANVQDISLTTETSLTSEAEAEIA
jgi:hypothetical protein